MNSMLDMVLIPEGYFLMGADENSPRYEEQPQRQIWLSTYAIQRTPVTVGQWDEFLRDTAYDWSYDNETLKMMQKLLGSAANDFDWSLRNQTAKVSPGDNYPIVFVSWFDACQFTKWLKETLGGEYALPTDAQWEKACRGQNGQLYPWGNQELDWDEEIALHSNFKINKPVGCCPERQSPYGCLDMWQNVCEWCKDYHDSTESYYHDPAMDIVNPTGPATGEYRVYRGGNLLTSGWPRCTYREYQSPNCYDPSIGFRVVLNYS